MEWLKRLFGWKKPVSNLVELKWSGLGTLPDGGSQALCAGPGGKASTVDWGIGMQLVPAGKLKKLVVKTSKPAGFLNVIVYRFVGDVWVSGWAPSLDMSGKTSGELDLADQGVGEGFKVLVWIGYPLINNEPVDIQASVFVEKA